MRYATDKIWEYKVGNLYNRRIDGGIEENLVITGGDEEEERPAMKQENTELEVARARGGRGIYRRGPLVPVRDTNRD